MAASINDKLRKYKSLFSTTLSTGIGTGTSDTITPATVTGLPTDTAITLTIDRVDSSGTATPSKLERIKGIISGGNLIDYVRGVDGTTEQAHSAGAVVEMVWNAADWNDAVDGILVQHGQDGVHTPALVTSLGAAASDVNAGTSDTTIVTPKALADSNVAFTTDLTNYSNLNAPQGFLINGKIVPSVASDNLTVAIKGLDGNDPSATNPVYCRIGDTIRSITAALSVTKNAGTNWCNAGGAELATKEIDYFVYLGYNATDGVVIGFSRIPYATLYSDFSATATNEKYCGISTITTAAAGDAYENIGRFAATLSAGAGYTWTVPTFTAANLIQRPIYETRRLSWLPTYGGTGSMTFAVTTTTQLDYQILNRRCLCRASVVGTTGGVANSGITFSLPISRVLTTGYEFLGAGRTYDTSWSTGIASSNDTSQSVIIVGKGDNSNWGVTTGKYVYFDISYSI